MAEKIDWLNEAWEQRAGPAVLATVDTRGKPNIVYVGEIDWDPDFGFVVADNYFDKTRRNIKAQSPGAILFITGENKSYQVKGALSYHTEGAAFERMLAFHNSDLPGVAATVLTVETAYSGSEQLL